LESASPAEVKLAKATPAKVRVHGGAAFPGKKHRSVRAAIAACSTVPSLDIQLRVHERRTTT
jgi:hypothetical protein